ncbi:hypothetical protein FS837_006085 [Tulasnella sp. UAMH 9824]|nr:hypothetical protein FS837_006085 [Tulasnella sp. UAMH 9824]
MNKSILRENRVLVLQPRWGLIDDTAKSRAMREVMRGGGAAVSANHLGAHTQAHLLVLTVTQSLLGAPMLVNYPPEAHGLDARRRVR